MIKKPACKTVEAYLAAQPAERRAALSAVREVILKNLPPGYVECIAYGMIGYVIPLARFPKTYNGHPLGLAILGAQKNHLVLHLMCIYGDTALRKWFEEAFRKAGKKLDAGKGCVRFRKLEDLPLEVIGEVIARVTPEKLIGWHERAQAQRPHTRQKISKGKAGAKRAAGSKS